MNKETNNGKIIEYSLEINFTQPFFVRKKFVLEKTYHKVMAKTKSMIAIKNTNALNEQMVLLYRQDYKDNRGAYSQIGKISVSLFDISEWKRGSAYFYCYADQCEESDAKIFKKLHTNIMRKVRNKYGAWFDSSAEKFDIKKQTIEIRECEAENEN